MRLLAVSVLALAQPWGARAESPGPVEIVLAVPAPEHPVFAGRSTEIPLRVRGEPRDLRARWYAVAPALLAPLGDPFALALPVRDGDGVRIRIQVPEVERESALELHVEARAQEGWAPAGRLRLRAYPADLLEPLRRFASSHPIEVRDTAGRLSQFLRDREIPTWQGGDGWSARPAVIVYAGQEASDWSRDRAAGKQDDGVWRLVLAADPNERLAHVVVEPRTAGGTLRVQMPLLQHLERDPEAQRALVEIFALLQEHRHERGRKR